MKTQNERVLEAFLGAPGMMLTTADIDAIPYMTNQRARISDLRARGHIFKVERIKGKHQSKFTYLGHLEPVTLPKETPMKGISQWRIIPNNFEVMTSGGHL